MGHGKPQVDGLTVLRGMIGIQRNGLRRGAMGVFARSIAGLAAESAEAKPVRIDASGLKAQRMASRLRAKGPARCASS